ncbi:MAG: nucleotide 5'-monophosphate nucleosidase PpnN [Pseudomonadota bacterium]
MKEAIVSPEGSLELLSQEEIERLRDHGEGGLYSTLRRCALAVLTSGSQVDDVAVVMKQHQDFDISIVPQDRGVRLALKNAPSSAFVDGRMIRGIRELLFAVLRDIVYVDLAVRKSSQFDLTSSTSLTNAVFHILRNARVVRSAAATNIIVCWGGHAISRAEYDYTKLVGYELGLRSLNVCTGCGPGAMKGPMKGATIGHAKQRIRDGRYIGLTEPGIIAAESPNPIVNELVILPDMEKRLEAFVRVGHGIVVFPGGVGTAEEILYLLGVLLHPDNTDQPLPVVLTGPASAAAYFEQIDNFIAATLGGEAQQRYRIIVDDPAEVAREMATGMARVEAYRREHRDAFHFNWRLQIDHRFQEPFAPTHEAMRALDIRRSLPVHELAANLRRVFSGIVAGNVHEEGHARIAKYGPFEISGSSEIMTLLDDLLRAFVEQGRMKLAAEYTPCYRVLTD